MTDIALFVQVVRGNDALPSALREHADKAEALERHQFDKTYIEFLDEQVRLSARGEEWSERLKRRRKALAAYTDVMLLRGNIRTKDLAFTVEVHPGLQKLVHWEQYDLAKQE